MKKFKRGLLIVLGALFVLSAALFAAACGDPITPPTPEGTHYKVELDYEQAGGSVTVTPPADAQGYAEGETVTVEVRAYFGYLVGSVKVGETVQTLNGNSFTFTVTGDMTVTVEFLADETTGPALGNVGLNRYWRGNWTTADHEHGIRVAYKRADADGNPEEYSICVDGEWLEEVTIASNTATTAYEFTLGGDDYLLEWADVYYSEGYMLHLRNYDTNESLYLAQEPFLPDGIAENYIGTWYGQMADGAVTLVITDSGIRLGNTDADLIVDMGVLKESLDGWHAPINAHVYLFTAGGAYHMLSWYPSDGTPIIGDSTFYPTPLGAFTIPEAWVGSWTQMGGDAQLEITADGFKIDGQDAELSNDSNGTFVEWKGAKWRISSNTGSDFVLLFQRNVYDEYNIFQSTLEEVTFLKSNAPSVKAGADLRGTTWKTQGEADLVIDAQGDVMWGERQVRLVELLEYGGAGGDIGIAMASLGDENIGYTAVVGNMYTMLFYDKATGFVSLGGYEFMQYVEGKSGLPAAFYGTWQVVNAPASFGTHTLEISETEFKYNGTAYTLSRKDGTHITEGCRGYSFTVPDLEGDELTFTFDFYVFDADEGLKTLIWLSVGDESFVYLVKSDYVSLTPSAPSFNGAWEPKVGSVGGEPIEITGAHIVYGAYEAIILYYDETEQQYTFLAGGVLYSLKNTSSSLGKSLLLVIANNPGTRSEILPQTVEYGEGTPAVAEKLPTAKQGTYKTTGNAHTVIIEADGTFKLDGTAYDTYKLTDNSYEFLWNGVKWQINLAPVTSSTGEPIANAITLSTIDTAPVQFNKA